ncbi:HAD family hydrolase [Carboxylicivirga sp. N1Y90]|uniref:HAD family hydrolase n=1 Tax=Carboxylicivirga fragile TaxID=3417571 RepID=UPI003D3265B7|nr:beta-phosphoglucomutase family hydrolase [Marinilabiliaceae bacterium N1Y90]
MIRNTSSLLEIIVSTPNIKAIICDMDGTLVDTLPAHYEAWLKACAPYNVNFSMDYFQKLTGRPAVELAKDIISKYNLPIEAEELVRIKNAYVSEKLDKVEVIQSVFEVIQHFHGKLPMTVGTGAREDMATGILEATKLRQYFDAVVTSDNVSNYKPHPETFLKGAAHVGVKPENCLVLEDGDLGIDAAKSAGMMVIDVKPFY